MQRSCGSCSLCCKLLPMKAGKKDHFTETIMRMVQLRVMTWQQFHNMTPDFNKPAGAKCPHQRHSDKGCCNIYAKRPFGCRFWDCRWLVNNDTDGMSRPDRAHYVIDSAPDFVTDVDTRATIPVLQIWLDPKYPDAWKDDRLLEFLERRGKEGFAAIFRTSSDTAFVVFPPSMSGEGWVVKEPNGPVAPEHTPEEKVAALKGKFKIDVRL